MFDYFKVPKLDIKPGGVLLFVHNLKREGAQTLLFNITKKFVSCGINVCVISPSFGPYWKDFNDIAPLRIANGLYLKYLIKKLSQKYGYKKAICNSILTIDSLPILRKNNYKTVFLVHEMQKLIKDYNLINKCQKLMPLADIVVFPSSFVYNSFLSLGEIPLKAYKIKNQGLFNSKLRKIDISKARLKIEQELGLKPDSILITNVGTAGQRKGFDLFLDVAYLAMNIHLNYKFIWVGDRTEEILTKKLKQYNIDTFRNLILPGYLTDLDALNSIYAATDLFLLTSREDPFPSVVLDALMSKTPVIAFEGCGGFEDVVKNDITGYLIKAFDTEQCLAVIDRYVKDKALMKTMQKNCQLEAFKHNFDDYCYFLLKNLEEENE